jgi:choline kinase
MKAIILAAGMGTRLGELTKARPKCLMEVRGRTLLERQIDGWRAAGAEEVVVVRGYLADQLHLPGARYVENRDYANNGLLLSLFSAREAMSGGFVFSYGDTIWREENARALLDRLEGRAELAVVADLDWAAVYEGRDQHPVGEAECVALDARGQVARAGKVVGAEEAYGEVAGMGGVGPGAAAAFVAAFDALAADPHGLERPFGQKGTLRHAYVVDLMLHVAHKDGLGFWPVPVRGGWREIDTPQDLDRAQRDIDW